MLASSACPTRPSASVPECLVGIAKSVEDGARLRTLGIVGGAGRMGSWLGSFFENAGLRVLIHDLDTKLGLSECVERSDAVLLSVPISETGRAVDEIAPLLRPGQLVLDNASVKAPILAKLLAKVPHGVEVLGMHTVFGPSVLDIAGQNVVLTETAISGRLAAEVEAILVRHGARVTHASARFHDRQMAFHQNLEHFTKLVLAELLAEQFPELDKLERFSSPNSRNTLRTLRRVLRGNPEVMSEIQQFNDLGVPLIRRFLAIAENLVDALEVGDHARYRASIEKCRIELRADSSDVDTSPEGEAPRSVGWSDLG